MYHAASATLGEEDDERDDTDDGFVIDDEDGQELAAGSTVQTNLDRTTPHSAHTHTDDTHTTHIDTPYTRLEAYAVTIVPL